jgi:hypothetical protein
MLTYLSGEAQAKYRPQGEYEQQRRLPSGLFRVSVGNLLQNCMINVPVKAGNRLIGWISVEEADVLRSADCQRSDDFGGL